MKRSKRMAVVGCIFVLIMMAAMFFMKPNAKAAEPKQITLKCTVHMPPPPPPPQKGFAEHIVLSRWAKEIEAKTEGRVKVQYHYSAVLGKPTDFLKMVGVAGVADMGLLVSVFHQWDLPLLSGMHQPFLYKGVDASVRAYQRLYKEWSPMREEYARNNVKPLWWFVSDPYYILLKKPISKVEELNGQKIYASGGFAGIVKRFGAIPTFIPGPEAYEALERGVLDGIAYPFSPIYPRRFHEVRKVFVNFDFVGAQAALAMVINLKVWNALSLRDREVIEQLAPLMTDDYISSYEETRGRLVDVFKAQGCTFIELSSEDKAKVTETCAQEILDEWAALSEKKGIPAKEFLKRYKAIYQELAK